MNVQFKDNSKQVLSAFDKGVENGLKAIGFTAERYAKEELTKKVYTGDKDWPLTGRLRNSVTFALSGKPANISSYKGDHGEEGGTYSGNAPSDGKKSVFIGTGVEYAPGIELGTHRKNGAVHFLQKAASQHSDEYKKLVKEALENA